MSDCWKLIHVLLFQNYRNRVTFERRTLTCYAELAICFLAMAWPVPKRVAPIHDVVDWHFLVGFASEEVVI